MSIDMRKKAAINMIKEVEANKGELFKKANVYMVDDYSGSMGPYYNDPRKPVTTLAEQIVALALARIDPDGVIPMWLYGTNVFGPFMITEDNLHSSASRFGRSRPGIIEQAVAQSAMGSTNMAGGLAAAIDTHISGRDALTVPGLIIAQTDGVPDDRQAVIREIVRASQFNIFIAFIGYGRKGSYGMSFLEKCDRGGFPGQVVDNCSVFIMGSDPLVHSDETVYREILQEIPEWRRNAAGRVQGAV